MHQRCAQARDISPDARRMGSQPRGHCQSHLRLKQSVVQNGNERLRKPPRQAGQSRARGRLVFLAKGFLQRQRTTKAITNGGRRGSIKFYLRYYVWLRWTITLSKPPQVIAKRYAQCRADKVVATAHWHICLPHIPSRHQSKQKSQFIPP
jgi:hypothetical protein